MSVTSTFHHPKIVKIMPFPSRREQALTLRALDTLCDALLACVTKPPSVKIFKLGALLAVGALKLSLRLPLCVNLYYAHSVAASSESRLSIRGTGLSLYLCGLMLIYLTAADLRILLPYKELSNL